MEYLYEQDTLNSFHDFIQCSCQVSNWTVTDYNWYSDKYLYRLQNMFPRFATDEFLEQQMIGRFTNI